MIVTLINELLIVISTQSYSCKLTIFSVMLNEVKSILFPNVHFLSQHCNYVVYMHLPHSFNLARFVLMLK